MLQKYLPELKKVGKVVRWICGESIGVAPRKKDGGRGLAPPSSPSTPFLPTPPGDCKDFKIQVSVPAMDYDKFKESGHGIMPEIVKVGPCRFSKVLDPFASHTLEFPISATLPAAIDRFPPATTRL